MITAIRFYDATIAVALAMMFAIVLALIAVVITGVGEPNVSVAIVVFVLVLQCSFACGVVVNVTFSDLIPKWSPLMTSTSPQG